jgi:hypothetical protein
MNWKAELVGAVQPNNVMTADLVLQWAMTGTKKRKSETRAE